MKIKNFASLWKRLLAYIFDAAIINVIIIFPFSSLLEKYTLDFKLFTASAVTPTFIYAVICIVLFNLLYWIILEYKFNQTLGKFIFGISVTSQTKPTLNQIILRNITKPFTIILLIDVLYMLFKRKKQRLFEVFSNTWVINEK